MKTLTINEKDNVAVLLEGEKRGHKIALRDISPSEKIIKYGYPIGTATCHIKQGEWVHSHNLSTGLSEQPQYTYQPNSDAADAVKAQDPRRFEGFLREDGRVGIRNEIWIIPTVGCVAKTAEILAREAEKRHSFSNEKGCGGVFAFPHPYGCSQLGGDLENTRKILAGLAENPNAGGVLLLGLGCENNRVSDMLPLIKTNNGARFKTLECQLEGDEIETGLALIDALFAAMSADVRTPQPISKLIVGLKCGGSDGFSGITANPLTGFFADRLISAGGDIVLTEVPEMFGAETILMNRCETEALYQKTVDMINNFKDYYRQNNQPVYENPSPGNKDGGITTLEEKSLGCVTKGGHTAVRGVIEYGGRVKVSGLTLLSGPGNDLVAATALAASGAQMILFTTGRGTPLGCPVPTVKISTNSELAQKKQGWIDFDAGSLLSGKSMESLESDLFELILQIAGGEKITKGEQNGYRDMAIFKTGVTL